MNERRSLGDAMNLTPEKLAFIKGQPAQEETSPAVRGAEPAPNPEKTVDLPIPHQTADSSSALARGLSRRTSRGRPNSELPVHSDILDQILVPVTLRLHHRTAHALKRAYLEQKLKRAKPDTLQEIGEEAVTAWLVKAGYLE